MKHFLDINKTNLDDLNAILEQAKKNKNHSNWIFKWCI